MSTSHLPFPPTQYQLFWQTTRREQAMIVLITALIMPIYWLTLTIPEILVNSALEAKTTKHQLFAWIKMFNPEGQLWVLCVLLLLSVLAHGGMKYLLNLTTGRAGELTILWLRQALFERLHPEKRGKLQTPHSGALIPTMINECEKVGSFSADAFSVPIFQGATLLTTLLFLFGQNPKLALAAIIFFPIQAYVVPYIQRRINTLNQERVRHMRLIGVYVTEAAVEEDKQTLAEIHQRFEERQRLIYSGRMKTYHLKYYLKFLNNLFAQLTPLLFYGVGGWLILHDRLTIGALVAALSAHKHLIAPWQELLGYYQDKENGRVRFEMLRAQFGEIPSS